MPFQNRGGRNRFDTLQRDREEGKEQTQNVCVNAYKLR